MQSPTSRHEESTQESSASVEVREVFRNSAVVLREFTLPAVPSLIGPLREELNSGPHPVFDTPDWSGPRIGMALEEALANAVYHGSLELDSSLKEEEPNEFTQLAHERCAAAPYCHRRLRITQLASRFGMWITIRDEGSGFDVAAALERSESPDVTLASGRGLTMIRAFSDDVIFNETGNEITLVFASPSISPEPDRTSDRESDVLVSSL